MPKYIDYHEKLTPLPQLPPARVKQLMNDIKAAKLDDYGVKYINFFSAKNGHGFCVTEAPSVEALVQSHQALGLPLEAKDVHEIVSTLADENEALAETTSM